MAGSHFTGPLRNNPKSGGLRQWYQDQAFGGIGDPTYCTYFNDFLVAADYAAADWVITTTELGGGDATEALAADEACGALLLTNDGNEDDLDAIQGTEEVWRCTSGKQLWFETRVKTTDADQVDEFWGLSITDTTALASSDQVGFLLADGSAALSFVTVKNSTTTTTASVATLADDTYVTLGFHWDGIGTIKAFVNRSLVATHTTNLPDDENMCITFHHQNGEAANDALYIDYIYVSQER